MYKKTKNIESSSEALKQKPSEGGRVMRQERQKRSLETSKNGGVVKTGSMGGVKLQKDKY
jgi:hypothetical protein